MQTTNAERQHKKEAAQAFEPAILAAALRLSLSQGRVMVALLAQPVAPLQVIDDCTGGSAENSRRVVMHRLRDRLRPSKVQILSLYGAGYSIPPDDRARIVSIVNEFKRV
jgi:hypothetical protein